MCTQFTPSPPAKPARHVATGLAAQPVPHRPRRSRTGLSASPNDSAASTPPPPSWAPPGRRYAKPSSGMSSACPSATLRPSASGPSPPPASAPASPSLDPVFMALNPGALPARERSPDELHVWVRRDEEYATPGANVVVKLHSESHARRPTTRAWAIIRRAERAHRNPSDRQDRGERRPADRSSRSDPTSRSHQPEERGMVADAAVADAWGHVGGTAVLVKSVMVGVRE